ncbi:MAG TPA: hypothetical protein P5519_06950 [Spirochaetia bacterium]|nr:hypothetical protein [Spirochaetia bacterium]
MSIVRHRLMLSITIFLIAGMAFAFGAKEDPLVYIDKLIAEQKYDEAILYPTDFMKKYPERFDEAQARLKRIVEIRAAYNNKAKELLDVIVKEPENNEKKLAMIKELQTFEKNPSTGLRDFIDQTKSAALFTYNRAQFESIMSRGRELLAAQQFVEAAKLYETGFVLYRDEFAESSLEKSLIEETLASVDAIKDILSRYEQVTAKTEKIMQLLADAYKAKAVEDITLFQEEAKNSMVVLYELRRELKQKGTNLQKLFAELNVGAEIVTENSFLPFAYRLILGRKTGEQLEGLVGTLDADWIHKMSIPQTELDTVLEVLFKEIADAYNQGQWQQIQNNLDVTERLCLSGMDLITFWNMYVPEEIIGVPTALGEAILASKGRDYIQYQHAYETIGSWRTLVAYQVRKVQEETQLKTLGESPVPSLEMLGTLLAQFDQTKTRLYTLINDHDMLRKNSMERAEKLAAATKLGYSSPFAENQQSIFDAYALAFLQSVQDLLVQAVTLKAQYSWMAFNTMNETINAGISQVAIYIDGETKTDPLLGTTIVLKYPGKALELSASMNSFIQNLLKQIDDISTAIKKEAIYIAQAPLIVEWLEKFSTLNQQLQTERQNLTGLTARAADQKRLADAAKLEAERRLQEATAAFTAGNFDTARERLERARERYSASLALEENPALRAQSDAALENLAKAILKAENDKVIADTRRLLTQGKNAYFAGNFTQAEDALLQARGRWKTTNAEPEPEVEYWLRLVQNAVTIQSGREIPVTAPLYPEMSQLLALAQKYYDEGAKLLAQKNTPSALRSFAQARQKIEEVKLMYPLNRDARILDLRIDKLIDSDAFYKKIASMVQTARAKIQAKTDLAVAYSDLKDIEALEPNYPGLKALLADVEILLGLRLPPPDPKAIAESKNLTAAAQKIYDSRDVTQFPNALIQLNRALELNPNNEEASRLKDKIATFVGATTTIVIPAAGEAMYNEAVRLFSNGDYLLARSQLAKLLQTYPQAAKMQKVIDLDARLKALGY